MDPSPTCTTLWKVIACSTWHLITKTLNLQRCEAGNLQRGFAVSGFHQGYELLHCGQAGSQGLPLSDKNYASQNAGTASTADCAGPPARVSRTLQNTFLSISENGAYRTGEPNAIIPPFDPVAKSLKTITGFRTNASLYVEFSRSEPVRFKRRRKACAGKPRCLDSRLRIHAEYENIQQNLHHGLGLYITAW